MRLGVSFVTMPALLAYLGVETLGVWLIALSLLGLIGFLNMGMSGAVVTAIGRSVRASDHKATRQVAPHSSWPVNTLASSAMMIALLFSAIILLVILPIVLAVDWHRLFQLKATTSPTDITWLMAALTVCLAAGFAARLPKFILMGLMMGYSAHLIEIIGIVVAGAALIAAITLEQPLYVLAAAFILGQHVTMAVLGSAILIANGIRFWSIADANQAVMADLAREGSKLAVNQASFSVATQSDLLLIGAISGAADGTGYGVVQRLFALPVLMSGIINDALWPAVSRADAQGDHVWVRRVFLKTLVGLAIATAILASLLGVFVNDIIEVWLGQRLDVDWLLVSGMVAWALMVAITRTSGMLLRAKRKTTLLSTAMTAMMVANVAVSIALIHQIGAAGAIWGTVIAYAICVLLPYYYYVPQLLREAKQSSTTTTNVIEPGKP